MKIDRSLSRLAFAAPLALAAAQLCACAAPTASDAEVTDNESAAWTGIPVPPRPFPFPTCTSETLTDPSLGAVVSEAPHCAWDAESTSPSGSYGNGLLCANTYVVEVEGVHSGVPYSFVTEPAGFAWDQAACEATHTQMTAWAHDAAGWHTITTETAHGVWYSGDFHYCAMEKDGGSGPAGLTGTEGYDRVRVGGRAWKQQIVDGKTQRTYVPVTAGIFGGSPC